MDRREFNRQRAAELGSGATCAYSFIRLSNHESAIVDSEDFERLNQHLWTVTVHNGVKYAKRMINAGNGKRKHVYMHHEILQPREGMITDHKNRNGLDNRKNNLREVTFSQNLQNSKLRGGKSQYRGVFLNPRLKSKPWFSKIGIGNGKKVYLGSFASEKQAAMAYDLAARKYYGENAAVNFPLETE